LPKVSYPVGRISGVRPAGETILEAVRALGYIIDHACGGNARCGTCCIRVVEGEKNLSEAGPEEAAMLRERGVARPHRLSCQAKVLGDIVVLPGC